MHLEFGVAAELADSGRARYYIVEGSSMRPAVLSHRDSLLLLQQTSELAERLSKAARLGRAGCWLGVAKRGTDA